MTDKYLDVGEWKKFAKGRSLKDAGLLKAYGELDKAGKDAAAQVEALGSLAEEGAALAKVAKADKEVVTWLTSLGKSVQAELKEAQARLAAEQEEDADPAELTTKMVPLLRDVKAGDLTLQAKIVGVGKHTAVMLSRKTISPARRKLLVEYLAESGTPKVWDGTCLFENNAVTFVLEAEIAGLAKRIAAALLAQTGQRIKVRVRTNDPTQVDEDDSAAEPPAVTSDAPGDTAPVPDPARAAYEALIKALQPRVGPGRLEQHPAAAKIRALLDFAEGKAKGGEFKAAQQTLEMVAKLLTAPPAAVEAPAPGGSATGSVQYAKARLAWQAARKKAQLEIATLKAAIEDSFAEVEEEVDEDEDDEMSADAFEPVPGGLTIANLPQSLARLDEILRRLDDSLAETLDEALNASDDEQRKALHRLAVDQMDDFNAYVAADPLLANLDNNPFVPVTVRATLESTLQALERVLRT